MDIISNIINVVLMTTKYFADNILMSVGLLIAAVVFILLNTRR